MVHPWKGGELGCEAAQNPSRSSRLWRNARRRGLDSPSLRTDLCTLPPQGVSRGSLGPLGSRPEGLLFSGKVPWRIG